MKKKFKDYFKENKAIAKALFKKRGSYIKYYVFYVMKLLSFLLFPLIPIINVAEQRMLRNIKKEEYIDLCKVYRGSDNPKNYFTYIASSLCKYLLIISVILVIGLIGGLVFLVMGNIDYFVMADGILAIVSVVPFGVLILVFIFLMMITLVPVAYVIDTTDGINMSKVLHESFNALWKDGKWQKLLSYVMQFLILLGFTLGFALPFLIPVLIDPTSLACNIISIVLFAALVVPYLRALAKFDIIFRLYRFDIYEEHVRDVFDMAKRISGVEIERVTVRNNQPIENKLSSLFDGAQERSYIAKPIVNTAPVKAEPIKNEALNEEKPTTLENTISNKSTESNKPLEEKLVESTALEKAEEPIENPITEVEEPIDESIAEVVEEPIEEPTAEVIEEPIEEPVAEVAEEPIEEPVAEVVEESIEEPVAEVVEEPIEEPIAEVEEPIEEPVAEAKKPADEAKKEVKPKRVTVKKPKLKKKEEVVEEAPKPVEEPVADDLNVNTIDSDLDSLFDDEIVEEPIGEPVDGVIGEDDMDLAQDSSLDGLIDKEKED